MARSEHLLSIPPPPLVLVVADSDMDMMDDMDDEEAYEGGSSKTGRINKGRWKKEEVCLFRAPLLHTSGPCSSTVQYTGEDSGLPLAPFQASAGAFVQRPLFLFSKLNVFNYHRTDLSSFYVDTLGTGTSTSLEFLWLLSRTTSAPPSPPCF